LFEYFSALGEISVSDPFASGANCGWLIRTIFVSHLERDYNLADTTNVNFGFAGFLGFVFKFKVKMVK